MRGFSAFSPDFLFFAEKFRSTGVVVPDFSGFGSHRLVDDVLHPVISGFHEAGVGLLLRIGDSPLERNLDNMRTSLGGREELAARVQQALSLPTKKQAEMIADTVIAALEATLLNNLSTDGFTLKLGSFGKFSVRHKPGILRKIPFTGETILTNDRRKVRFVSLGRLRQREQVV
jgi:nucleoid DNA-binding protein